MKRFTFLLVPVLLLTVLVLVVAAEIPTAAGAPGGVQTRLEQYRSSLDVEAECRVCAVVRAKRPWNLTRDLGWPVLGDSLFFQTDQPLTWSRSDGPSPLPFPPKEVWCARLESKDRATGAPSYSVVLVGLHIDMYTGDWVVHQPPDDPSTIGEMLSLLGCELELE
jgi:hypothetical protein